MDKKTKTFETYNKNAKLFAAKFDRIGSRVEDIKEAFNCLYKENPNVLELGCGNGRDAGEILKLIGEGSYLGIDVSEEFINIARENVPNAKFEVADFEKYSFSKNIDLIFAFASLIHSDIDTLKVIFSKAYESLNANGIFYLSLKHGDYKEQTIEDGFGERTHYLYSEKYISELLEGKFKILKTKIRSLGDQEWLEVILKKSA